MSLAVIYSRVSAGMDAPLVTVETHISNGLPSFSIVGLPETAVKESKDRVRSAIINSQFEFPAQRITVNLAPADLPKDGGRFDLPIALGILAASEQIPSQQLSHYEFAGELALTGELRAISGALPFAIASQKVQRAVILPEENANEAALTQQIKLFPAQHLLQVCKHLSNTELITKYTVIAEQFTHEYLDLGDVHGQYQAKRVLEIAAAGQHSLLMRGPPGTGKTMLASRLPGILAPLNEEQALEVASLYSISHKKFDYRQWRVRPFRAPHHTASSVALVGGGNPPRPGEISLAHHGVLFLDELPEYHRHVLESLREPLESGAVTISRASFQTQFPARFQFIAAMNPCPCGYVGDPSGRCRCTAEQIERYQGKISGPLLDRIDLFITIPRLAKQFFAAENPPIEEKTEIVRARVVAAQQLQFSRANKANAFLQNNEIEKFCRLPTDAKNLLITAMDKLNLSARAYHRIIKVARTIADLASCIDITAAHVGEALSYRNTTIK